MESAILIATGLIPGILCAYLNIKVISFSFEIIEIQGYNTALSILLGVFVFLLTSGIFFYLGFLFSTWILFLF